MSNTSLLSQLAEQGALSDASGRLRLLRAHIPGRLVFTSSLGLEDQVLTHLIATQKLDIEIVTLDTGRLFPESYALWAKTEARYGVKIRPAFPQHEALETLVSQQGIDGFYASIEARKACCFVRKVAPLKRALAGAALWITGLRADQSEARGQTPFVSFDESFGLMKANPLLDWSRDAALSFAKTHDIPLNPLHESGFVSIGCAPCTRAIRPGESERAGRWWWERDAQTQKECGLHIGADGKIVPPTPNFEANR
jgi:phosphoadenosine phosphosulfate reductase